MKYVINIELDRSVDGIFLSEVKEAIEKTTEFRCVKDKDDNKLGLGIGGNTTVIVEAIDRASVDLKNKILLVTLISINDNRKILLSVEEVVYKELLCKTRNFDYK
ncbi:MAG: hypothetical protein NC548_15750 [Lachnospiraceae bacterium]|nr:hypothetical protein [Lachnospiraceae bacterium]